jgi:hypothetical protein
MESRHQFRFPNLNFNHTKQASVFCTLMSCGSLFIVDRHVDTAKLIRNNVGNIHFQLVNSKGF